MFVTIINDCGEANEMGRQTTRAAILFPNTHITLMKVSNFKEIEAGGNLVDILDVASNTEGVVLVNAAPRHGSGKHWNNGTPFGYFYFNKIVVVSTIAGETLSLAKKFNLIDKLYVTDLPTVIDTMVKNGKFAESDRDRTVNTQFRSLEYMPFLARWLVDKEKIPSEKMRLADIPNAPTVVWWIDGFGNCKTTLLPEEVGFEPGKKLKTKIGELTCFSRLKDVPNGEAGMTIGSSGYKNQRFLEITVQGKSAAKEFNLTTGTLLF